MEGGGSIVKTEFAVDPRVPPFFHVGFLIIKK